jgi:transposase
MGNAKKHIRGQKGSHLSSQLRGIPFDQVLVVAIDAGKYLPKALVCNYFGEILEDSFFFTVDSDGFNLVVEKIESHRQRCNVQKIIIGIEPTGQYHEHIVRFLEGQGYSVSLVNAYTTFEERASTLNWSKTDDRDLRAIISALLANKTTETKLPDNNYEKLQAITRAYRAEVDQIANIKAKIRQLMYMIWPGFQGSFKGKPAAFEKIFSDFWGKTPVLLMENYPHPEQVLKLGKIGLQELSRQHNLKMRATTIEKLLKAARLAISRNPEALEVYILQLSMKLQQLKQQEQIILTLKHKMEEFFVQTPGILLLSVPEIGVVTAATLTAEMGPVERYSNAGQIIKRGGTDSLISQSGGHEAKYRKISKQGNSHLRSAIYMAGFSLATGRTNPYFKEYAVRLKDAGKKKRQIFIATGNKFVRIAFAMLRNKSVFSPPTWIGEPLAVGIFGKLESECHRQIAAEALESLKIFTPEITNKKLV